ncbi:GGDEF domain-containing protein [Vibrio metschnikovii]|uniref:GGDEF domain-containing protein n=1 Tax=Vibrio metschnikovii TaxID=28172 RepID=UPI001CC9DFCC|nr:GGDEF domain-containing protein [Vibrio metschnikovii]
METLLNKIQDAGLDVTAVNGEEAIIFWHHVYQHIANSPEEKALCLTLSAEYRAELNQLAASSEELNAAMDLLSASKNIELILSIKQSLSERLIELSHYHAALNEYVTISHLAVTHGYIDDFAQSVLGMGNLCDAYGDHNRALRYYQKIDALDHALSSRSLRLRYKLHMLACYLHLQRFSAAYDLLKECEELSILVSDKTLMGQIALYQAKLCRQHGQLDQAITRLSHVQYVSGNVHSMWLSNMIRIEQAYCLLELDKAHMAALLLTTTEKRLTKLNVPILEQSLYAAFSEVCERQGDYQRALYYEKKGFRLESDLVKRIPIGELGAAQLRRLARFEPQLKLILSEQENRELKETTEHQKNTVAQLQQDVFTDPLTQLHNRRWLEIKLKDLLLHETSFAFLVVDIDHFKSINDELSHLVGDKAITHVSETLADYFKFRGASCVRFGGEEFLVILESCSLDQAIMHADTFRERIVHYDWQTILGERGLTVSIGVTLHREGENTQRTFYRADKALYRAKANGRNQVCSE